MQNSVSGYGGIKSIARKPNGGFYLVRARSLLAAWITFKRDEICLYDLRLWLACHEMIARRCKAADNRIPTFTEGELVGLVGGGTRSKVRHGIKRLVNTGLLDWNRNCISTDTYRAETTLGDTDEWLDTLSLVKNNRRKVPVPRRLVRYVIKTRHRTLIGAVFGHLFRCLYYRKNRCVSGGRCKASWIAAALQLDLRNVKAARKQLIQLGWIVPCSDKQELLNRWGLPLVINLQWHMPGQDKQAKTPLPTCQNRAKVPPPIYDRKPLSGSNNQNPARNTGVQNRTRFDSRPSLKHITIEDLRDAVRLDILYRRACAVGSLPHSQSNRLQWFAAAERALSEGTENPCGLFMAICRKKLWSYITQKHEDAARAKLKKLDFGEEVHLPGQLCGVFLPVYDNLAA